MAAVHLISRLICAWFAFILPCFRSFQALHHRPLSDNDVELWAKYWSVIGVVIALEYTVEWLVSWFPFYWEIKTLFLLFLSLPQIQGSTFIYESYLAPFLTRNEADLDHHIEAAKTNIFAIAQNHLSNLLSTIMRLLQGQTAQAESRPSEPGQEGAAPTSSVKNAARMASSLWNTYGSPYAAMLYRSHAAPTAAQAQPSPSASSTSVQSTLTPPAYQRGNHTPESQIPLPVTPEHVYAAHQSSESLLSFASTEGNSAPPFPVPQHF